jgi:hypothetical protein
MTTQKSTERDNICTRCGHRHDTTLAGICIGCPCPEGGWKETFAASSAPGDVPDLARADVTPLPQKVHAALRAPDPVDAVLRLIEGQTEALRAEVERLRSWLPPRVVEQPVLFGSVHKPRHVAAITEGMRTYCDDCSAAAQEWITTEECPELAHFDIPAHVTSEARAVAAEVERDVLAAKVAAVEAECEFLFAHHDGSLVTSDYPLIARRFLAALGGGDGR